MLVGPGSQVVLSSSACFTAGLYKHVAVENAGQALSSDQNSHCFGPALASEGLNNSILLTNLHGFCKV